MNKAAIFLLALGLSVPVIAQQQLPNQTPEHKTNENQDVRQREIETPQSDQGAGQDMKDAGHSVKKGTEKGYHKTKNGTKKAYHKTKKGVKKGVNKGAEETGRASDKVQDKTQ